MALPSEKKISEVVPELCVSCGNCTRCPYMAITLDKDKRPIIDPAKCVGCGLCTLQCFVEALRLRERKAAEKTEE